MERSKQTFNVKEYSDTNNKKVVEYLIGGKTISKSIARNLKQAKKEAFDQANKELEKEAVVIRSNPNAEKISVSKDDEGFVSAFVERKPPPIDSNNVGYRIMERLGWSGGGLGCNNDGIRDPISLDFGQTTRLGLGAAKPLGSGLNQNFCKEILEKYYHSEEIRDLQFTTAFTKEERGLFHAYVLCNFCFDYHYLFQRVR